MAKAKKPEVKKKGTKNQDVKKAEPKKAAVKKAEPVKSLNKAKSVEKKSQPTSVLKKDLVKKEKSVEQRKSPPEVQAKSTTPVMDKIKPQTLAKKPIAEKKPEVKAEKVKKIKIDKSSLSQDESKWHSLFEKHGEERAAIYDIKGQFESSAGISHKIFGWGWVLSNEYDRLEVLFKDGRKMLISNRK